MVPNHHKNKNRSEEHIIGLHKITGPDGFSMVVEKGGPGLPMWARLTHAAHITPDRALADANTQFQQFTSNAFGSPQPILADYTQDERYRVKW